jgi:hypothetical protein
MADQATSAAARAEDASDPELRAELVRAEEEILRLRDLLIRKDLELGVAKGRLAELDDRAQRIASAAGRIETAVPGLGRLVGTALRMLQSQRR